MRPQTELARRACYGCPLINDIIKRKFEEMKTPSGTIKYVVHHAGKMVFSELNRIAELLDARLRTGNC